LYSNFSPSIFVNFFRSWQRYENAAASLEQSSAAVEELRSDQRDLCSWTYLSIHFFFLVCALPRAGALSVAFEQSSAAVEELRSDACMFVCVCVCMYVCLNVFMQVCMCVFMYEYI